MADQWAQYAEAPAAGDKWAQYAENPIESHKITPQGHQPTEFEQEHPTLAKVIKSIGMSGAIPGMAEMPLPGSGAMLAPQAIRTAMSAVPKGKLLLKAYDAVKSMIPGAAKAAEAEAPPISPEEYYRGQSRPMPSAEDYYSNQGVKAAEVPPQPAQSAPAPTTASAAPTAKVQPIRPPTTETVETPPQKTPEIPQETAATSTPKPASGATAAKSARYADAITKWAADRGISPGTAAEGWEAASPETRGRWILQMKRAGYLEQRETIPNTSASGIIQNLKARAAGTGQ